MTRISMKKMCLNIFCWTGSAVSAASIAQLSSSILLFWELSVNTCKSDAAALLSLEYSPSASSAITNFQIFNKKKPGRLFEWQNVENKIHFEVSNRRSLTVYRRFRVQNHYSLRKLRNYLIYIWFYSQFRAWNMFARAFELSFAKLNKFVPSPETGIFY